MAIPSLSWGSPPRLVRAAMWAEVISPLASHLASALASSSLLTFRVSHPATFVLILIRVLVVAYICMWVIVLTWKILASEIARLTAWLAQAFSMRILSDASSRKVAAE